MSIPTSTVWPRNCTVLGTDRFPSILGSVSTPGTCGVLIFETDKGNEGYLYLNGTNPMTLMFGGVTEVMTNPAGGTAIGTPVAAVAFDPQRLPPGFVIYGTPRVSCSIMITPTPGSVPAIGIMNNQGNDIKYLYVLDTGALMTLALGTEANWLAKAAGTTIATKAPSGARGRYIEGRTILVDTPLQRAASLAPPNCVVVQSGGRSAAVGLMNGEWQSALAISYDPVATALRYDAVTTWLAWSNS